MQSNNKISKIAFTYLFLAFIFWVIGLFLDENVKNLSSDFVMFIYEWFIIVSGIVSFVIWKKIEGYWLSPFIIVFLFFLFFNAGQFIMWGFGIHYVTKASSELGVATHIRFMDVITLMRIMFVTFPSILFFFGGALLAKAYTKQTSSSISAVSFQKSFRYWLKNVGIVLFVVTYALSLYDTFSNFNQALAGGYSSIYYGDAIVVNPVIKYLSYMFLPSLFAVFIGCGCTKKTFWILTILYLPYLVLNLLIGDRGSWIYFICLWAWCYLYFFGNHHKAKINRRQKRKNFKRFVFLGFVAIVALTLTTIFTKFREIGFNQITSDDVIEVLSDLSYVFVKPFFEMGQSARCLGIVLQDGLNETWNGGNTYLAGIVSMPLPRIKLYFGFFDGYFENWFSQSYMGIENYGLGFTAIAEAYLNGGIFYPIYIILFGVFMGNVCQYKKMADGSINAVSLFISLASTITLITACRGSMELSLRKWFYGFVLIYLICYLLSSKSLSYRGIQRYEKKIIS